MNIGKRITLVIKNPLFRIIFISLVLLPISGCSGKQPSNLIAEPTNTASSSQPVLDSIENSMNDQTNIAVSNSGIGTIDSYSFLNPEGSTLESRINPPKNFSRIPSSPGELSSFMRTLTLKESGSDVLLFDGSAKVGQDNHVAVFGLDVGDRDLQQCADSVMRIYAEYYWSIEEYDKISFHLTNGFLMEYTKWRDGNRILVNGNEVSWTKTKAYDDSYETFRSYLTMVYSYAGTLSLSQESKAITLDDMRPGDMFLQGGSPGHCVLVVDIAEDENKNRCFLLAQGYMPAQDFHIINNPLHLEDPWYYASEITSPLRTPSWTFDKGSPVRWSDFPFKEIASSAVPSRNGLDSISAMSGSVQVNTEQNHSQVTILAVGDNLIHMEVIKSGKQLDGTYNYDHLYSQVKDEISAADIAIINQETILGGDQFPYSGYPSFNSPTEIGDSVVKAGFDVILHATNHTMDMGLKAVEHTFNFWKQHPEITVLGINESEEQRETIPIVEKNGIKIAMLNYTYSLNGYHVPDGMPYLVNMLDKGKMVKDIKKAKKLADFIIVFPHWGSEYVYEATTMQMDLTKFYYEQGVDLILGTHPHVLEPVEWIELNEDHRMLVYYSLGNFMSYQKEAPRMLGGIANITITKDKHDTYISDSGITPIVTHYEHGPVDYNYGIYKLADYTNELALIHGVSDLAAQGPITFRDTYALAKQVLGSWFLP